MIFSALTAAMKTVFEDEFTHHLIARSVPGKAEIEKAIAKHKFDGITWLQVKNFMNAKAQYAKKHNK